MPDKDNNLQKLIETISIVALEIVLQENERLKKRIEELDAQIAQLMLTEKR